MTNKGFEKDIDKEEEGNEGGYRAGGREDISFGEGIGVVGVASGYAAYSKKVLREKGKVDT